MSIEEGRPYSCRNYEDSDLVILACHENASWSLLALSQLWSFIVWIMVHIICFFVSKWWNKGGIHAQRAWATHYIGTRTTEPIDVRPDAIMRFGQLTCSTITVLIWVQKSYLLGEHKYHYYVDVLCSIFFLSHLIFALLRYGFSSVYVNGFETFLDCFTITPLILQHASPAFGATWLTISYLRVYRIWTAFTRLAKAGILEPYLSDFNTVLITKIIECVCVIVMIAGTLWIIEGLGDIPGFFDRYIDAGMGKISFFQMCYFSFITISTVGYGDYSPTTIPGRFFILIATIGGVTFFSIVSMEFVELQRLESSGGGKYRPSKERGHLGHILLIGGGVDSGAASVIKIFLQALCRDENTPDIVLLGASECTPDVRTVIRDLNRKKFYVKYFQGTPMSADDLKRVRADTVSFAFVIADFNTAKPLVEDESNILRTGALARFRPSLNYRLMLVHGQELELAMQVGLDPHGCYALSELKASMLALNLRSPGLSTLILNLCLPNIPSPDHYSSPISPWLKEYIQGADLEVYGFPPHEKYHGKSFKEVAYDLAVQCNVIVIAAHVSGTIMINPQSYVINCNSVLFAMSSDDDAVDICARNGEADKSTWQDMLEENRERARKTKKLAGYKVKEEGNTSWLMKAIVNEQNKSAANSAANSTVSSFIESSETDHHIRHLRAHNQSHNEQNHHENKSAHEIELNLTSKDFDNDTTNDHVEGGVTNENGTSYLAMSSFVSSTDDQIGTPNHDNSGGGGDDDDAEDNDKYDEEGNGATIGQGLLVNNLQTPNKTNNIKPSRKISPLNSPPIQRTTSLNSSPFSDGNKEGATGGRGLGPLPSMGMLTKRSDHPPPRKKMTEDWHPSNFTLFTPKAIRARSFSKEHENNLSYVVENGGHTILCVLGSGDDAVQAWKIVEMIVGITRRTHDTPIIVVAQPSAKLKSLSHSFLLQPNGDTLFVIEGDPKRMATLLEAGVETCEQFITLAPTAPPADMGGLDGTMMDRENLLACSVLEHHLERWDRTDLAPVYDWFHPDAIKFMSPPPAPQHVLMQSNVANSFKSFGLLLQEKEKHHQLNPGGLTSIPSISTIQPTISSTLHPSIDTIKPTPGIKTSNYRRATFNISNRISSPSSISRLSKLQGPLQGPPKPKGQTRSKKQSLKEKEKLKQQQQQPSKGWGTVKKLFVEPASSLAPANKIHPDTILEDLVDGLPNLLQGDMEFARIENRCHYRFAAGRVLPKPAIAALFSMAYYTPGILELIEALVNPTKTEQTSLVWVAPVPLSYANRPYSELAMHFYEEGTIPMGLLRGSCGPLPFVVAKLPSCQTMVESADAIYFIATYEWADHNLLNYFDQAVNGGKMPNKKTSTNQTDPRHPTTNPPKYNPNATQSGGAQSKNTPTSADGSSGSEKLASPNRTKNENDLKVQHFHSSNHHTFLDPIIQKNKEGKHDQRRGTALV
mmetsp:Transcript_7239/g.8618  ORF Transcript_7239/g.8618 Transcript_7239/m.8618 type:complete len:1441 (+) Transcript_7239:158-4480(+)